MKYYHLRRKRTAHAHPPTPTHTYIYIYETNIIRARPSQRAFPSPTEGKREGVGRASDATTNHQPRHIHTHIHNKTRSTLHPFSRWRLTRVFEASDTLARFAFRCAYRPIWRREGKPSISPWPYRLVLFENIISYTLFTSAALTELMASTTSSTDVARVELLSTERQVPR